MAKLWVLSLWFGSAIALLSASALGDAIQPKPLKQGDEYNPALVSAWLKANGATADRARADLFFKDGLKGKKRGAWGPAVKGFGASAQYYPSPQTLIEYADAALHSLGSARAYEKSFAQYSRRDMASFEPIYRSVLAADSVLNTLSPAEKAQMQQNSDCLNAFVRSVKFQANCPPLETYGLTSSVFASLGAAIQLDPLKDSDQADPALLIAWLKTYGATADKAGAAVLFKRGLKEKKKGAWHRAVTNFCEGALYYPTPQALSECANAHLQSSGDYYRGITLAQSEREERERIEAIRAGMKYPESIYRSALAVDTVLNTLSAAEKKQTRQNADCLSVFVKSGKVQINCQPLQAYGLAK